MHSHYVSELKNFVLQRLTVRPILAITYYKVPPEVTTLRDVYTFIALPKYIASTR